MNQRTLTTKEKALALNLDRNIYGSFAEIGAGQEVAAHFFKAGGASGSVAKTMSAYDMSFSDAIYGKIDRYVCEERLQSMLDKEYGLLTKRLTHRASHTNFFVLANTVESLNYQFGIRAIGTSKWTYIEGSRINKQNVRTLFSDFPSDYEFPEFYRKKL